MGQSTDTGNQIYAVYLGPYPDQASARSVSTGVGNGAYVKQMDPDGPARADLVLLTGRGTRRHR